jgi:hypothetical protein
LRSLTLKGVAFSRQILRSNMGHNSAHRLPAVFSTTMLAGNQLISFLRACMY